ncbi:proline-rich transmembrane protein 1-like [Octopus bimaculoides]|uniref:proline-rich transmembrane protein 1-like n=1 Tax=Octopus bimaculoides TaxID=37653 RepID=UPI0022E83057|nr:proline-rich transmembrane protein 1-like [Octopus bimaculoides]
MEFNDAATRKAPPGFVNGGYTSDFQYTTASGPPPEPPPTYWSFYPEEQQPQQPQQPQVIILQNNPQSQSEYVKDLMPTAILVTLCCFLPTGIAAIAAASEANSMVQKGQIEEAKVASKSAKSFIKISFLVGSILLLTASAAIIIFNVLRSF